MKTFAGETLFLSCLVLIVHSQLSVIHPRPYLTASHLLTSSSVVREVKGRNVHRQLRQPEVEHLDNFSDNLDREDNTALPSTTRLSISNEYGERVPAPFDSPLATFHQSNVNTNNEKSKVNVNSIRLVDPFKQPDPYEISADPLVDNVSDFGQESSPNKTERKFSTRNGVYSLKEQSFFAASEQDNAFAPSEDNNKGNNEPEDGVGVGGYSESVQGSADNEEQDNNLVLSKLTSSSDDSRKKRLSQCVQTCVDDAFDLFK